MPTNLVADPPKQVRPNDERSWSPPKPFVEVQLPTFPVDSLPSWLAKYVRQKANATQTPNDLAGGLVLAVVAAAVARKVEVQVKTDWTEPLNIFFVAFLPSGCRKSAVFCDVTEPLTQYEQKLCRSMDDLPDSGDMSTTVLVVDDCTPERLAILLYENHGRIAAMSPEGDLFDLIAGRYSKHRIPNFGVFLRAHSGDDLRVDRVVGERHVFVSRPALSIGLAAQPIVLEQIADQKVFRGRGLLARFLFALPQSPLGNRNVDPPSMKPEVRDEFNDRVTSILKLPEDTSVIGGSARVLKLEEEAYSHLKQFMSWLEPQLAEDGRLTHMTDWAGKLAGAVVRIAGLIHMALDRKGDHEPWSNPIGVETIERAISFGKYFLAHAEAVFGKVGTDLKIKDAKYVINWMKRKGVTTFTKRDVFEGTKCKFESVAKLEPVLDLLVERGYIRCMQSKIRRGAGRPPGPLYEVSPLLFEAAKVSDMNQSNSANSANCAHNNNDVTSCDSTADISDQNQESVRSEDRIMENTEESHDTDLEE